MKTVFLPLPFPQRHVQIFPTLIILGGFFVIYKKRFDAIGRFDSELRLWGAENVEIAIKNWRCGGDVTIHPCARIGMDLIRF